MVTCMASMAQEIEKRQSVGDGEAEGVKEIIHCKFLLFPVNPTNQSKHWRIIVGFININKIPFCSICSAHAIFGGGSSFIHR